MSYEKEAFMTLKQLTISVWRILGTEILLTDDSRLMTLNAYAKKGCRIEMMESIQNDGIAKIYRPSGDLGLRNRGWL